jgi:hypothetical protein
MKLKTKSIAQLRRSGVKVRVTHLRRVKQLKQSVLMTLKEVREQNENSETKLELAPKGGKTVVRLEFPDGTIREQRLGVWHEDAYEKAKGINLCMEKILESVPTELLPLVLENKN